MILAKLIIWLKLRSFGFGKMLMEFLILELLFRRRRMVTRKLMICVANALEKMGGGDIALSSDWKEMKDTASAYLY